MTESTAPQPATTSAPPPRRKRGKLASFALKLGLLGAGLFIAALLVEAVVLVFVGEQPKFPRHVVGAPWGLRYNQPNAHYRHKSADVEVYFDINAQGMRAPRDFPYAKPPGVKRILSLGDSFTMGYEVSMEDCFNSVLERDLNKAGYKVEVMNCGVSGYSNAEECLYVERELLKYDPDIVMVSFFPNDLVDNIRAGLFRLEDGKLAGGEGNYIPGGRLGNFVNSNWLLGLLSERSNAFVLIKERMNVIVKQRVVEQNQKNVGVAASASAPQSSSEVDPEVRAQQKLCAAIFERLYADCRARNIPLLIHSIPWLAQDSSGRLLDMFPLQDFDTTRPGILFVPAKAELDPYVGKELLYWTRSHWHWTPFCHAKAGDALARAIIDGGLLKQP